jgi:hypothetical protein
MQILLLIYGLQLLFLMCEIVFNFPIKLDVYDLFIWPQIKLISNIVYCVFSLATHISVAAIQIYMLLRAIAVLRP